MIVELNSMGYPVRVCVVLFWLSIPLSCWLYCWIKDRKPKQRRCKDCATYYKIRKLYGLCIRTSVPMDANQKPESFKCQTYIRKYPWKGAK